MNIENLECWLPVVGYEATHEVLALDRPMRTPNSPNPKSELFDAKGAPEKACAKSLTNLA